MEEVIERSDSIESSQETVKVKKKRKIEEVEPENIENTKINFKNGITVYEGKMTFLIIGAAITLIFVLAMYFFRQDVTTNLTSIMTTFIMCIAGAATAEQAIGMFKGGNLFNNNNPKGPIR